MRASIVAQIIAIVALATPSSIAAVRIWDNGDVTSLASAASNWVGDVAPVTGDDIVLDATSTANMTWDAGAPSNVASWTQETGYVGTVTFQMTHPDYQTAFTNLLVAGNCIVEGGTWQHRGDQPSGNQQQRYWLNVGVGGNFTLGSNAMINVTEQGFNNAGPGQGGSQGGAAHGGVGGVSKVCYGEFNRPTTMGSASAGFRGGGVIVVAVSGDAIVNGVMTARGKHGGDRSAAGGSVWLTANSLTGTGSLIARGGSAGGGASGGGRVAVVLTGAGQDFSGFTGAMDTESLGNSGGACGTVYLETGDGERILVIDNDGKALAAGASTRIPQPADGTNVWILDVINLRDGGVLDVTSNSVLTLNSTTVTNDGAAMGFLRLTGGQFVFPGALTLTNNTGLIVDGANVLTGNVTVAGGAVVTHSLNPNNSDVEVYKMDLTIVGDLTIDAGGSVDVDTKGFVNAGPAEGSSNGGAGHGGRGAANANNYGSILAPINLGSASAGWPGGGSATLRITGTTTVNGVVSADGHSAGDRSSAAGSVYLTTGALAGNGDIRADSGNVSVSSGGGRVAVVVTNAGADFSAYTGTVSAHAKEVGTTTAPGTVFKRWDDVNREVHIENEGRTSAGTAIPATFAGSPTYPAESFVFDDDLSTSDIVVYDGGRLLPGDNNVFASLTVTNSGYVDFVGVYTQFVAALTVDGTNFAPGATYSVSNINDMSASSLFTGTGFVTVGSPGIVNRPASNITVSSANLNGTLLATGGTTTQVRVYWGLGDGVTNTADWDTCTDVVTTDTAGDVTTNLTLTTDRVYYYRYYATNDHGGHWAPSTEILLSGNVSLSATDAGASEDPIDTGTFTFTRSANATNGPTTVPYAISGTASNGLDYAMISGTIAIPEGQATADLTITPMYVPNLAPETVDLTILDGAYVTGTLSNDTVTITNSPDAAVFNVWVGSNPLDTNSWSLDRLPTNSDTILLGDYSTANLTWNSAMVDTLAGWRQLDTYSGAVIWPITYPTYQTTFTNLSITGNCVIAGGTWTHLQNPSSGTTERYRIHATIGGDFTLGSNATIDVVALGMAGSGATGAGSSQGGAAHGGCGASSRNTYGHFNAPERLGSGSTGGHRGGGAVRLIVASNAAVDGMISADGFKVGDRSGAGGSIWLSAATFEGIGTLRANGGSSSYPSGGGRVAVDLSAPGAGFTNFTGSMQAYAYGSTRYESAAGTIYRETGDGWLTVIVDNQGKISSGNRTARIPQPALGTNVWTVDEIDVRNGGSLDVTSNAVLVLTTDSVTNTGTTRGYVRLDGGTFDLPNVAGTNVLTVRSNVAISVDSASVVTGNVTLLSDGWLMHSQIRSSSSTEDFKLDLRIVGDLMVASNGAVNLAGLGFTSSKGPGFGAGSAHGGRGRSTDQTYGSITAPFNYGSGWAQRAGGAGRLVVDGTTTLEGVMTADAAAGGDRSASGGSMHLTTEYLLGGGTIRANGSDASDPSGGGRVAVELTGAGATFDAFDAAGGVIQATEFDSTYSASAPGTVYRKWSTGETILIDASGDPNDGTDLPPRFQGNGTYPTNQFVFDDDLADADIILTNNAGLVLTGVDTAKTVTVSTGTEFLDLGGATDILELQTMTITNVFYDDLGLYTTNDWNGFVTPTVASGDGSIRLGGVPPAGTVILFR